MTGRKARSAKRRHRTARGCLLPVGVAVLAAGAWLTWEWVTWPDVAALALRSPRTTAFIEEYRARQRATGERPDLSWIPVPYDGISDRLKQAVLVAEDINFFSHRGFDTGEMREAVREAWEERELPRGASTITQQLAKNLWLSPSRNPLRKLKEALLTRQLERDLGKRRILELYLNVVEFGPGVYGAEAASRRYFGKGALALTAHEAAQLAAALPRPSRWHPGGDGAALRRRVSRIERRMDRAEWILGQL